MNKAYDFTIKQDEEKLKNILLAGNLTWEKLKSREETLIVIIPFNYEADYIRVGLIDEYPEHHILMQDVGLHFSDIDKYFRIILDKNSASWACVCPKDYKNIRDEIRRTETYFSDGIQAIGKVLSTIGYPTSINIPDRYMRVINSLYK